MRRLGWLPLALIGCNSLSGISEYGVCDDCGSADALGLDTSGSEVPIDSSSDIADSNESGDANETGDRADADASEAGDAPCPTGPTVTLCNDGIPPFLGTQVVDGFADDFCGLPETVFVVSKGMKLMPDPAPSGVKTVVHIKAGWSPAALHLFFDVRDPKIVVAPSTAKPWEGDSIELYVGGGTLTGKFGGTVDPGAYQIAIAPATSTTPAKTFVYRDLSESVLDPTFFATRITPLGYAIELRLPWTFLSGSPLKGKTIGFDLVVNVDDDPIKADRDLYSLMFFKDPGPSPCAGGVAFPYCDDRCWCTPQLL